MGRLQPGTRAGRHRWLQRGNCTCVAFVWQQREAEGPETMPLFVPRFVARDRLGIWAGIRKTSFYFCRPVRARLLRGPCGFLAAVAVRRMRAECCSPNTASLLVLLACMSVCLCAASVHRYATGICACCSLC